jgi:hypothetical protein
MKPLEVGNIKVQMMQEKEHTVYVYRMIKLFNKEVRTLFIVQFKSTIYVLMMHQVDLIPITMLFCHINSKSN